MAQRDLIVAEFERLKRVQKLAFVTDVAKLKLKRASTAEEIEKFAVANLATGKISWNDLTQYVARQAVLGKQHVWVYDVPKTLSDQWDSETKVRALLKNLGHSAVLGLNAVVQAPQDLELSSVSYSGGVLEVLGAGRRDTTVRNMAEESKVQAQLPDGMQAKVYETKPVRAWVRLTWNTNDSTASLHIGQLGSENDYREVVQQFFDLIPWLPNGQFTSIKLANVIAALHVQAEKEQLTQTKAEAQMQGADYNTGGVRQTARAMKSNVPMLKDTAGVVEALKLFRDNGIAARGNVYWRKNGDGGATAAAILTSQLHTDIAAEQQRVKVMRPVTSDELKFLLSRLRVLAQ